MITMSTCGGCGEAFDLALPHECNRETRLQRALNSEMADNDRLRAALAAAEDKLAACEAVSAERAEGIVRLSGLLSACERERDGAIAEAKRQAADWGGAVSAGLALDDMRKERDEARAQVADIERQAIERCAKAVEAEWGCDSHCTHVLAAVLRALGGAK